VILKQKAKGIAPDIIREALIKLRYIVAEIIFTLEPFWFLYIKNFLFFTRFWRMIPNAFGGGFTFRNKYFLL